jgi:hypothetical protein
MLLCFAVPKVQGKWSNSDGAFLSDFATESKNSKPYTQKKQSKAKTSAELAFIK